MQRHLVAIIIGTALALAGVNSFAATASSPAADAGTDAHRAYMRDLGDALGRSDDADALLTAALIDGFGVDGLYGAATTQGFGTLLARAEQAAPHDPLVWWVAATQCRGEANTCAAAQREARGKLLLVDADNAVAWLLECAAMQESGDHAAAAHAFAKAAAATRYDDHMIASVKMLAAQLAAHPVPDAVRHSAEGGAVVSPDAFASTMAWAIASAFVMPSIGVPFSVCTPNKKPVQNAATVRQCLDLARTMQHANTLMAMSVGLRIEQRLLAGTRQVADVDRRERKHHWMIEQMSALAPLMSGDSVEARRYRSVLHASNSERAALEAMMKVQGIPLDPPANWQEPAH